MSMVRVADSPRFVRAQVPAMRRLAPQYRNTVIIVPKVTGTSAYIDRREHVSEGFERISIRPSLLDGLEEIAEKALDQSDGFRDMTNRPQRLVNVTKTCM